MIKRILFALAISALFAACQPASSLTPVALNLPAATLSIRMQAMQISTPLPPQTLRPLFASRTPSQTPSQTPTVATSTPIPSTLILNATTVPTLLSTSAAPSWSPPPASAGQAGDHFLLDWPILNGAYTLNRAYPYGATNGGRLQVHHGDDLVNPLGTPIYAAGDGTVFYAGNDFTTLFGPYANYYGNLVVIQHNFLSPEGLPVYTLYGHMAQVTAEAGQAVRQGDLIGTVGATGIALGPHVHVEVRLGSPFDFGATRNPELWLRPPANTGLLVGRVTNGFGNLAYNVTINVISRRLGESAFTYGDHSVNSDPALRENFTLGNLTAGYYAVRVIQAQRLRFDQTIYIAPNQITWISIVLSP